MTESRNDLERQENAPSVSGESVSSVGESVDPHADKYNDPRVQITRRGVLMGIGVVVLGMLGAAGSIYQRRTRLEKSRKFWGDETIIALQLGERLRMDSISGLEFETVELTSTPGLAHLRHALLDERSYDWSTVNDQPIDSQCRADGKCVQLHITDPTAHRFQPVKITLDLKSGWVGPADGGGCVKTTDRVRPALGKFLETLINVQQKRYDMRK